MGTGMVPMETLSRSDVFLAVMGGTIVGGMILWIFGALVEWAFNKDEDEEQ